MILTEGKDLDEDTCDMFFAFLNMKIYVIGLERICERFSF